MTAVPPGFPPISTQSPAEVTDRSGVIELDPFRIAETIDGPDRIDRRKLLPAAHPAPAPTVKEVAAMSIEVGEKPEQPEGYSTPAPTV
jgi:hypothetical protein